MPGPDENTPGRPPGLVLVDFADLGTLPPESRRIGHVLAQTAGAVALVTGLRESARWHLAVQVSAAYHAAGGVDDDGGLDLDLPKASQAIAGDPAILGAWEQAKQGARRDLLAACAQSLALTRRRCQVPQQDVAVMIGEYAGAGHLWLLAERQLNEAQMADRDISAEQMIPDGPHLPALVTSPVSVYAEQVVVTAGNADRVVVANVAALVLVELILDTNTAGDWQKLLSALGERPQ
jgi:hypothetical protein